jgi:hypothetical protein
MVTDGPDPVVPKPLRIPCGQVRDRRGAALRTTTRATDRPQLVALPARDRSRITHRWDSLAPDRFAGIRIIRSRYYDYDQDPYFDRSVAAGLRRPHGPLHRP